MFLLTDSTKVPLQICSWKLCFFFLQTKKNLWAFLWLAFLWLAGPHKQTKCQRLMYLQPGLCAWDDRWTLKPDLITVSICHCNITHMTNKNRPISSWQSYDKIKNLWHVKASIKDVLQTSVGMNAPEGHCSNPSLSLCSNVRVGSGG